MREAETCAVSIFVFTKIALRDNPFQITVEAGVKLLPVTVSVKVGCSAWILVGEIVESVGVG